MKALVKLSLTAGLAFVAYQLYTGEIRASARIGLKRQPEAEAKESERGACPSDTDRGESGEAM